MLSPPRVKRDVTGPTRMGTEETVSLLQVHDDRGDPESAAPGTRDAGNRRAHTDRPRAVCSLSSAALALAYRGGLQVSLGDPIAYLSMACSWPPAHGASLPYGDLYTASPLTARAPVTHWPVGYPAASQPRHPLATLVG